MTTRLDHLVIAVPDLTEGVDWFARQTGVRFAEGGSHPGLGTANCLATLGGGAYVELIGPDPDQNVPPGWLGVGDATKPTITTWAVRPNDMAAAIAQCRAAGYDPGEVSPMSRRTADGTVLRWSLTPANLEARGVYPFLIDWGSTPHPTSRQLPSVELVSWAASGPPGLERILRDGYAFAGFEPNLLVGEGSPLLTATLAGPSGRVVIGS